MAGEAMLGLSIFNTMMSMAKALKDIDNAVARNAAVIELQDQIFAAHSAQTGLVARVDELEKEIARFEHWEREKQRYELHEVGRGSFVYRIKEGVEPPEPPHQICAHCYEKRQKSILRAELWTPGRSEVLTCQNCGSYIYLTGYAIPDHDRLRPRRTG